MPTHKPEEQKQLAKYFLLGAYTVKTKKELADKQRREEEAKLEAIGHDTPRREGPETTGGTGRTSTR